MPRRDWGSALLVREEMLESPFTVAVPIVLLQLLAEERRADARMMRKKHHLACEQVGGLVTARNQHLNETGGSLERPHRELNERQLAIVHPSRTHNPPTPHPACEQVRMDLGVTPLGDLPSFDKANYSPSSAYANAPISTAFSSAAMSPTSSLGLYGGGRSVKDMAAKFNAVNEMGPEPAAASHGGGGGNGSGGGGGNGSGSGHRPAGSTASHVDDDGRLMGSNGSRGGLESGSKLDALRNRKDLSAVNPGSVLERKHYDGRPLSAPASSLIPPKPNWKLKTKIDKLEWANSIANK